MAVSEPELTGYAGCLSVAWGERTSFPVSTDAPDFDLRIVGLIHGDTNPRGPGHKEIAVEAAVAGQYPGRIQQAHAGSFGVVEDAAGLLSTEALTLAAFVQPTTPVLDRDQGIVSLWSDAERTRASLYLDSRGVLTFRAGEVIVAADGLPLRASSWYLVAGGFNRAAGVARAF